MDEKQAKLSHFAGLIRIIVALVLIFILVFSFTRWASQRRSANRAAEKAGSTPTQKSPDSSDKNATTEEGQPPTPNKQMSEVPSGIDDSIRQPSASNTKNVPETGTGTNVLLTILMLSLLTYLGIFNQNQKNSVLSDLG